jgi:hypothetical protein
LKKPAKIEEPAIEVTPPGESLEVKEFKFDSKDPINRQFIPEKGFAQYSRYFVYDFHKFGVTEPEFALFIRDVDAIIKSGKKPVITVEASASKVPSSDLNQTKNWWTTEIKPRMIKSEMNWPNTSEWKEKTSPLVSLPS